MTEETNYGKGCGSQTDKNHYCGNGYCLHVLIDPPRCPATQINVLSQENAIADTINLSVCYDIRDNFLVSSEKGQWYHTYYYAIGKIAADNNLITVSKLPLYLKMYRQTVELAQAVRYGSDRDVPLTAEYVNNAEALLTEYKTYATNETDKGYLNQISADLKEYSGKDVKYIRNAIK